MELHKVHSENINLRGTYSDSNNLTKNKVKLQKKPN